MPTLSTAAAAALLLAVAGAACAPDFVAVEVMPPRSEPCAPPTTRSSAFSRGLFDLNASTNDHGAYVGDLRVDAYRNLVVKGVAVAFTLPDGASSDAKAKASAGASTAVGGDVVLNGTDPDLRAAIIEDVEIVPRDLAVALRDSTDMKATAVDFATLGVSLTPTGDGISADQGASTFAIDLCRGCLVDEPSTDVCPNGTIDNVVCRPGQEDPLFLCAPAAAGGATP